MQTNSIGSEVTMFNEWRTAVWLRCLPNYAALAGLNIVHNITFYATPEEPLPQQRQGTMLALMTC